MPSAGATRRSPAVSFTNVSMAHLWSFLHVSSFFLPILRVPSISCVFSLLTNFLVLKYALFVSFVIFVYPKIQLSSYSDFKPL
jgi:hypothetical protein